MHESDWRRRLVFQCAVATLLCLAASAIVGAVTAERLLKFNGMSYGVILGFFVGLLLLMLFGQALTG